MAVSEADVRQVFRGLENGNRGKFFDHVADNVDWMVEGAHSLAAKDGVRFDTRYCWVVHFAGEIIDQVRAYLDSAMVARLFDENRNLIQSSTRSHNGKVLGVRRGEGIESREPESQSGERLSNSSL